MDPIQITIAVFVFLLGACVGSFLNVVVYRMPRDMSLVHPPSTCPKCGHRLAAYDNVPVLGWLWLRGKCRYCHNPISARYPIVELITGCLFLFHFLLLFHFHWGPYEILRTSDGMGFFIETIRALSIEQDWPILLLHLWLIASLLGASLIDLEHFIIPLEICWILAIVGALAHTFLIKQPPAMSGLPTPLGMLYMDPTLGAMTVGAGVGLLISLVLLRTKLLKRSFEDDAPPLENDLKDVPQDQRPDPWPASRIRKEIRREMLFLLPSLTLACLLGWLVMSLPAIGNPWRGIATEPHVAGFLGSLFGALVGGAVVWFFRIAGSYGFGREAMGLGDVHLMFGVGAVIGAGGSTVAFFLAPIFGLGIAIVLWLMKGRREIPYGPYLSLATYAVLLFYTPIYEYLAPGMQGLIWMVQGLFGSGGAA